MSEQEVNAAVATESGRTFPRMTGLRTGYDPEQVDSFFKRAKESFDRDQPQPGDLDARAVRTVGFDLVRGGYHVAVVDAALDRLEDTFAKKARDRMISRVGKDAWMQELSRAAASLRGRLTRPEGERFKRAGRREYGYDIVQVDELCNRINRYFTAGEAMSVDEVRRVIFKSRRGRRGYDEDQVDAFLDRVVDVMSSVD
ncbi:DivIVA domain-containing protein [Sediminivirga luteola]|uniref:DivIVA domain-containing protein n=1 Tax=Sediminivirga luteola TaxID=1774748 RepID=UPI001F55DF76